MNLSDIKKLYQKVPDTQVTVPPSEVAKGGDPSSTTSGGSSPVADNVFIIPDDIVHSLKQQSLGMGYPFLQYRNDFIKDAIEFQLNGWSMRR